MTEIPNLKNLETLTNLSYRQVVIGLIKWIYKSADKYYGSLAIFIQAGLHILPGLSESQLR